MRSESATWTLNSASAMRAAISGALNSIRSWPSFTILPRSTCTFSTYPATLACSVTLRKGWISAGSSTVRDKDRETTGVSSTVCCAQAARLTKVRVRRASAGKILGRIIVTAVRIHGIQGRRCGGRPPLQDGVNRRQNSERREGGDDEPADNRAAKGRRLRTTFAEADGHGDHAENHRRGGHENGAQTAAGAFLRGFENGPAVVAETLGEGDQENRISDGDSDGHDRAHERLHVERRAGD